MNKARLKRAAALIMAANILIPNFTGKTSVHAEENSSEAVPIAGPAPQFHL